MKSHRKYLSTKFNALKSELEANRKAGQKPKACSVCGFKSAIPNELTSQIAILQCRVCDHHETQLKMNCPHCNHSVVLANEGHGRCHHCKGTIEPEDIAKALCDNGTAARWKDDDIFQWRGINCGYCTGYHTVVNLNGSFFCTKCFNLSDDVEDCEWCNEPNTGDMEDSYFLGCGICEGKGGWGGQRLIPILG